MDPARPHFVRQELPSPRNRLREDEIQKDILLEHRGWVYYGSDPGRLGLAFSTFKSRLECFLIPPHPEDSGRYFLAVTSFESPNENQRIADLFRIAPKGRSSVLEIGSRDGRVTKVLRSIFPAVTALDLQQPTFTLDSVVTVQGDVTHLEFEDNAFDTVCCTEVLEHVTPPMLSRACDEIVRVARNDVLIGVPYRQDLRLGRTTCVSCGTKNPPWGHVSAFDEVRLKTLFETLRPVEASFVGSQKSRTNFVSVFLADLAGNPWGTYEQEEPCISCGRKLVPPSSRTFFEKVCCKLAVSLTRTQGVFLSAQPIWIHMLFQKAESVPESRWESWPRE